MRRGHGDPASVHDSLTFFAGPTLHPCGLPSAAAQSGSDETAATRDGDALTTVAAGPHILAALYHTR